MLVSDPKTFTKPQFVCMTLWLEGKMSQGDIANRIKWSSGQVRGWLWRSLKQPRQSMKIEDRQAVLDILEPLRRELEVMQAGAYDDRFRAKTVKTFPIGYKEPEPEFPDTPEGRKAKRKYLVDKQNQQNAERHKRSLGYATRRGLDDSALEWLDKKGHLAGSNGKLIEDKSGKPRDLGTCRLEAGLHLRKYIEGAALSPLGAMDYERATMGDKGTGPKLALPAYRLHCIAALGSINQMMQQSDFSLIESVVERDRFIWEEFKPRSKERKIVFDAIRYTLDIVACHDRLLTHDEFKKLWDESLPDIERPVRSEADAMHEIAESYLRDAYV